MFGGSMGRGAATASLVIQDDAPLGQVEKVEESTIQAATWSTMENDGCGITVTACRDSGRTLEPMNLVVYAVSMIQ